ncbi:MAG: hypothetical protein IIC79_02550 [Chloroflexi bacterium]|nr:hypothetical protein [Chloroflexota bacterium]
MWDYSIRFGSDRYLFHGGIKPLVFGSTGKELLWGLPYLIPGIGIFGVRLWNALIKIIPHMFLGFLLVFDYKGIKLLRWERLLFGFWACLFLLQVPVQPVLIVSVIITEAFVRKKIYWWRARSSQWVEWVTRHLLKYYDVLESSPEAGVQLLIPRGFVTPILVSE